MLRLPSAEFLRASDVLVCPLTPEMGINFMQYFIDPFFCLFFTMEALLHQTCEKTVLFQSNFENCDLEGYILVNFLEVCFSTYLMNIYCVFPQKVDTIIQ